MAFVSLLRFTGKSVKELLPRGSLKFLIGSVRCRQYSKQLDKPFNYMGSKAARVSISDNLKLKPSPYDLWYKPYVLGTSFVFFCLYFFVLREENYFDEMLKTDAKDNNLYAELVDLKIKVTYCRKHNLPYQNLMARMNEIKTTLGIDDE